MKHKNRRELYNIGRNDSCVTCHKCQSKERDDIAERMGWHILGEHWICPYCLESERDKFGEYR